MGVAKLGQSLDVLSRMPSNSVDCCVTSPPYWSLRDYGFDGQIGLEATPEEWCAKLVEIFAQVRRVLKPTGTLWLNIGDCYSTGAGAGKSYGGGERGKRWASVGAPTPLNRLPIEGIKTKDLVGQPWMLAFALRVDGWYLRRDIIWHKPNAMPESVRDRPATAHEYLFLLTKSEEYFYDYKAVMEPTTGNAHSRGKGGNPKAVYGWAQGPGAHDAVTHNVKRVCGANSRIRLDRDPSHQTEAKVRAKQNRSFSEAVTQTVPMRNRRSVWSIPTSPFRGAHFATFPERLVEPCILAGTPANGVCALCGAPAQCECTLQAGRRPAVVLDPFAGSFTTCAVAQRLGRDWYAIEGNADYYQLGLERMKGVV